MAKAISLARHHVRNAVDSLRTLIVTGCALALIMAGQAFPAFGL